MIGTSIPQGSLLSGANAAKACAMEWLQTMIDARNIHLVRTTGQFSGVD
jgi:hypothetical protein